MSLFDVLKYSGVDLDDKEVLDTLPGELLQLYREEVWDSLTHNEPGQQYTTDQMAKWYAISGGPKQPVFERALRKYGNVDF